MKMFPRSIRMQPTQPLSVPMVLRCRAMSQPRFSPMAPVSNIPPHQNTSGLKDVEKATGAIGDGTSFCPPQTPGVHSAPSVAQTILCTDLEVP